MRNKTKQKSHLISSYFFKSNYYNKMIIIIYLNILKWNDSRAKRIISLTHNIKL